MMRLRTLRWATAIALGGTGCLLPVQMVLGQAVKLPPLPKPRPSVIASSPSAEPAPPSECRKALTEQLAIAPSIPSIRDGACGGEDLVRLEAVVLPDRQRVNLTPPAILRCPMATAVVDWVRIDLAAVAGEVGGVLAEIDNFDSYECRGRNRIAGARLSEHGRANALDLRGFKFTDGRRITLTDRSVTRDIRERIRSSACARFATVLGPTSDWYHEDHIHLDLAPRRNNYAICQWAVLDPLPKIAPRLPIERPRKLPSAEQGAANPNSGRN